MKINRVKNCFKQIIEKYGRKSFATMEINERIVKEIE